MDVNGEQYRVSVVPEGAALPQGGAAAAPVVQAAAPAAATGDAEDLPSPLEGKFFLTKDSSETPIKVGDKFKRGDRLGYVEAMKTYNAILAHRDGEVVAIVAGNGDTVYEDDILMKIR